MKKKMPVPLSFRDTIEEIAEILAEEKTNPHLFESKAHLEIGKKLFELKKRQRAYSKNAYKIVSEELRARFGKKKEFSVGALETKARNYRDMIDVYTLLNEDSSENLDTTKNSQKERKNAENNRS